MTLTASQTTDETSNVVKLLAGSELVKTVVAEQSAAQTQASRTARHGIG